MGPGNHRAAFETFLLAFVLGEGGRLQTHFCEFVRVLTGVWVHVYRHVLQVCVYIQGCMSTGRCVCVCTWSACVQLSRCVLACVYVWAWRLEINLRCHSSDLFTLRFLR